MVIKTTLGLNIYGMTFKAVACGYQLIGSNSTQLFEIRESVLINVIQCI